MVSFLIKFCKTHLYSLPKLFYYNIQSILQVATLTITIAYINHVTKFSILSNNVLQAFENLLRHLGLSMCSDYQFFTPYNLSRH